MQSTIMRIYRAFQSSVTPFRVYFFFNGASQRIYGALYCIMQLLSILQGFFLLESSRVQLWRIAELCRAITEQFQSLFSVLMGVLKCIFFRLVANTFLIPIFSKYDSSFYMWLLATEKFNFLIVLIIQKLIFFNTSF